MPDMKLPIFGAPKIGVGTAPLMGGLKGAVSFGPKVAAPGVRKPESPLEVLKRVVAEEERIEKAITTHISIARAMDDTLGRLRGLRLNINQKLDTIGDILRDSTVSRLTGVGIDVQASELEDIAADMMEQIRVATELSHEVENPLQQRFELDFYKAKLLNLADELRNAPSIPPEQQLQFGFMVDKLLAKCGMIDDANKLYIEMVQVKGKPVWRWSHDIQNEIELVKMLLKGLVKTMGGDPNERTWAGFQTRGVWGAQHLYRQVILILVTLVTIEAVFLGASAALRSMAVLTGGARIMALRGGAEVRVFRLGQLYTSRFWNLVLGANILRYGVPVLRWVGRVGVSKKFFVVMAKLAVGWVGFEMFCRFLLEESLQTCGMAVTMAVNSKNPEILRDTLDNYKKIANVLRWWNEAIGWTNPPGQKVFGQYVEAADSFEAAAEAKLRELEAEVAERQKAFEEWRKIPVEQKQVEINRWFDNIIKEIKKGQ